MRRQNDWDPERQCLKDIKPLGFAICGWDRQGMDRAEKLVFAGAVNFAPKVDVLGKTGGGPALAEIFEVWPIGTAEISGDNEADFATAGVEAFECVDENVKSFFGADAGEVADGERLQAGGLRRRLAAPSC